MQDSQLIFMISLPRSGSTMLQKILAGHNEIYTRSEPWIMLHPLFALKKDGIQTRYSSKVAADGVINFLKDMPVDGESLYYSSLRDCYLSLYGQYLSSAKKKYFLDKTPRYYEVFDELQKTFPNAKYVILYRNPIAVLSSILETWVKGNLQNIKEYQGDLFEGVNFLQREFSSYKNTHLIRYEDLLSSPEDATKELFDFLEIPNQPNCVEYGGANTDRWEYGDPSTVYAKSRPDPLHAEIWQEQLKNKDHHKILHDYLITLGRESVERMGYSYEDLERAFIRERPQEGLESNLSLDYFMSHESNDSTALRAKIVHLAAALIKTSSQLKQKEKEVHEKEVGIRVLEESLDKKTEEKLKLEHAMSAVTEKLDALKQQRAVLAPLRKIRRYRELLETINAVSGNRKKKE